MPEPRHLKTSVSIPVSRWRIFREEEGEVPTINESQLTNNSNEKGSAVISEKENPSPFQGEVRRGFAEDSETDAVSLRQKPSPSPSLKGRGELAPTADSAPAKETKKEPARAEEKEKVPPPVENSSNSKNPKPNPQKRQQLGCLLLIAIFLLFGGIGLFAMMQSQSQPRAPAVNPLTEIDFNEIPGISPERRKELAEGKFYSNEPGAAEPSLPTVSTSIGGDPEMATKLILGGIGFLAFLFLLLGVALWATATDPAGKARARRILLPAGIFFLFAALANGASFAFFSAREGEQEIVIESPIAIEILSEAPRSAPLTVEFSLADFPQIGAVRYITWDFGDGKNGSGAVIRHTFSGLGDFEVKAFLTFRDGSQMSFSEFLLVTNILPRAEIFASAEEGLAPLSVSFDAGNSADANGSIIDYAWKFPGGESAAGVKTNFTFEEPGEFPVELKVTDNNAESSSTSLVIRVKDEGRPTALIVTEPEPPVGQIPFQVKFSGGRSFDENGGIVRYEWDFGDDSEKENGQNANHIFEQPGKYLTRLRVWDGDGLEADATVEVDARKTAAKPRPAIYLTKGLFSGAAPLTVHLDGGKSFDSDGNIVSFQWDFGDGTPSETGQKVVHTFAEPGKYEVVLTATDDDGLSATTVQNFTAQPPEPVAPEVFLSVEPDPPSLTIGEPFIFDASQSFDLDGTILSFEWNFGDGTTKLGPARLSHAFEKVGIFRVSVTAHDNSGRSSSAETRVAVSEPAASAAIRVDKGSGVVPFVVQFSAVDKDGAPSAAVSFEWDFGDGLRSESRDPLHIFTEPGEFTVRLRATDAGGVVSEDLELIEVLPAGRR